MADQDDRPCICVVDDGMPISTGERMDFRPHPPGLPYPCGKTADHHHRPVQHRDGRERWCNACGMNRDGEKPRSRLPGRKSDVQGSEADSA